MNEFDTIPHTKASIHEVMADLPDAAQAGELYWLLEFAIAHLGNSRTRLSAMLECDWTTVDRIYRGKYPSVEAFCRKVKNLREHTERVGHVPFIETIVSERMFALFDYLRTGDTKGGFMGKIVSSAGRGKTECGREYALRNPGTVGYLKVNPAGTLTDFYKDLARAMGISLGDKRDHRPLRQKIEDACDRNFLLIIDEASLLLPRKADRHSPGLEFIRHLHDSKRVSICLAVTQVWDDRTRDARIAAWLEQFTRRMQDTLVVPAEVYKAGEVARIVAHFRADPPDNLVTAAHDIANNVHGNSPGRLEALFRLLINASIFARSKGAPLTREYLLAARDYKANLNRWPKSGE